MKIGEHEFEAEGPAAEVNVQATLFARLLGHDEPRESKPVSPPETVPVSPPENVPPPPPPIKSIARVNGKVVSLGARPSSLDDAVLLLLLGQHHIRGDSAVAGTEIMEGLRGSGYNVGRADYIIKRHARSGLIVATGRRRRLRYQLTTDGAAKAEAIARTLAASIPGEPVAKTKSAAYGNGSS